MADLHDRVDGGRLVHAQAEGFGGRVIGRGRRHDVHGHVPSGVGLLLHLCGKLLGRVTADAVARE